MANTYDYKGTKITGTQTTAKKFPKSDVKDAKKNDVYLNKETGHVYKCTTAGGPSKAEWKYIRTDIVARPSVAVKGLGAPVRVSPYKMKAEWDIPKSLTNAKKGNRATGFTATWTLSFSNSKKQKWTKKVVDQGGVGKKSSTINLDNIKIDKETYTRAGSYFPNSSKYLNSVSVSVVPINTKGTGSNPATASREFSVPRDPQIGSWTFDYENGGRISAPITTNAGADYKERYDTRYIMKITDTLMPKSTRTWNQHDTKTTLTSVTPVYNVSDYQALGYDDYVQIDLSAWARGFVGSSKVIKKTYYVSYPKETTITDVEVSSTDQTGKCTLYINTNSTTQHPVDKVRLEYLANCDYAEDYQIPGDASWTSSDIVDDAACTALTVPVTNLIPDRGKYTWVRVKSHHAAEAVLHRYSKPWRVTQLEVPAATAADDEITILDTTAGPDGKSVLVHLGWNVDGQDDSTGTELSWSDAEDAWRSTEEPDTYEFTWSDGPVTVDNITYHDSATITIKDLHESTVYYIKARRYLEGETTTYSPYSNPMTQLTSEVPDSVVASCPAYVPSNGSLAVNWTFSSDSLQTAWQIIECHEEEIENETVLVDGTVIAEGQSSLGSTKISAERIADFATNSVLMFRVYVSTGSGYVASEVHTVTVIDPPTCIISSTSLVNGVLTDMPMTADITTSRPCNLITVISAQGAVSQYPEGIRRQTANDTVYSDLLIPEWTEVNNTFTATLSFPAGLDFWNLAAYTLSITAIDQETGLQADPVELSFSVNWSSPAVPPVILSYSLTADTEVSDEETYYTYDSTNNAYVEVDPVGDEDPSAEGWYVQTQTPFVTLTPIDTVDNDGYHRKAVQIELTPPTGSSLDDVYDIYRMTGDGVYMIGEGFPLTFTTADEYAPFGDNLTQEYRFAIRTVNGDVAFSDIEYEADGAVMRFDWSGGSLELPYNISISDKYSKDVEIRSHMDGTNDAYWNQNISRSGSLSSDVIRLDQQEQILAARALAHYPGAVFVRTPDGSAYEADVQITDLSTDGGPLTQIAIDATEIGLTQEFSLPIPFVLNEGE